VLARKSLIEGGNYLAGFSMVFPKEMQVAYSTLIGMQVNTQRPHWIKFPAYEQWNKKMLKLCNIKYIRDVKRQLKIDNAEDYNLRLVKNNIYIVTDWEQALRIFDKWEVEPDGNRVIDAMRSADYKPFNRLYLEKDPKIMNSSSNRELKAKVSIISKSADKFTILVNSNKNGILFIPELYHRDWKAYINDNPFQLIRANYSFRGVPILKGRHVVQLKFEYKAFTYGMYTSLISLLILYTTAFVVYKRKQHKTIFSDFQTLKNRAVNSRKNGHESSI
jgi:uncharacterized membrane protein YfhO